MESNKNNLVDNMSKSYVIKEILKELNKINGDVTDKSWVEREVIKSKLSQDEFEKIFRIMILGDLIEGVSTRMLNIENMKITLKGIEHLLKYGK
ncbi:YjcQ family protein [Clostridium perfringens]|uniref:YjcQ family protein n=1 Tax=Clostridium perfringens TaxID=1502 RepID=UPI000E4BDAA2|nr:hypothetical protein [Clostridium perfringens]RHN26801.1 hypothetical protein DWZ20_07725 [Clostridium perfringens]